MTTAIALTAAALFAYGLARSVTGLVREVVQKLENMGDEW